MSRWIFDFPQNSGETLILPPLADWERLVSKTAREENRPAREEVLGLAQAFSGKMALPFEFRGTARVLAGGHQPGFFHPGIWIKSFVLEAMASRLGATALHLQVDSDLPPLVGFPLPVVDSDVPLRKQKMTLYEPPGGKPFESLPSPSPRAWDTFMKQCRAEALPDVQASLDTVEGCAQQALKTMDSQGTSGLGLFLDLTRRACEPFSHILEVPLSQVAESTAFRRFAADVLRRLSAFQQAYNGHLDRYRREHKVRSAANPMPNLRVRGTEWEAPFWVVGDDGLRRGMWLDTSGTLMARDIPLQKFDGSEESLEGIAIRPRALTLTLFMRHLVCDLFIHGVGGARYDTVTDGIFTDFFARKPPPYACVSLTLSPDLKTAPEKPDDPSRVRWLLRDLQHNPQRYASPDHVTRPLIEEKNRLMSAIRDTPSAGQGPLAERIRATNQALSAHLEDYRISLEERRDREERQLHVWQDATARTYPYFMFSPSRIQSLIA